MKRAIKTHAGDFTTIIVLLILSLVICGYILHKQGVRFPLVQSAPYTLNAEFQESQAVTPGQGQTVRVSGVQIGAISQVMIKNGLAVVAMKINNKYKGLIHTDATALLRPKTGLKDMFIEVDPGTSGPVAKNGFTIPVSNTLPDVNPDEILHSLDADTRQYLDLLVNGAGYGLRAPGGSELAQVFERFEPTHQDLARLNQAVAARGAALRSLINSLQRLNTALAQKQTQIVQLVDSSSKVFSAFAAENGNVSRAIADLPGTLDQTTDTLNKVTTFARLLAPTSQNLIPAAEVIPNANAATIALATPHGSYPGGTNIIQKQIRPFVVAARPVVRNLRPASVHLATATPNLSKTFGVLNHLFNMLGYYPGSSQHGYLWWLAWLDHNARTLFSVQDANGDFRPLFIQASCASYTQIVNNFPPGAESVLNLTPILTSTNLCPKQAAANEAAYKAYELRQGKSATERPATSGIGSASPSSKGHGSGSANGSSSSAGSGSANGSNGSSTSNLFYPKLPTG